jgi:ADP-ribose pyrophosphatase YjhB (NUDIX family)
MTTGLESTDGYRNEPMALAAHPAAEFRVQIRHADAETFAEVKAWNERVKGMAGLAVRNDKGELLFIRHEGYGGWVTPGGRVEDGESFRHAAERETREESGVEAAVVRPLFVFHFVNRYDGKATDSYLVLFEGEALDPEPTDDPGEADEDITDVQWTATVPADLPDDEFVRETVSLLTDRFETISL